MWRTAPPTPSPTGQRAGPLALAGRRRLRSERGAVHWERAWEGEVSSPGRATVNPPGAARAVTGARGTAPHRARPSPRPGEGPPRAAAGPAAPAGPRTAGTPPLPAPTAE